MPVFGFQIEETTGALRRITLKGRALPYRDGTMSWGGEMRSRLTWYGGNPVATQQVLGPSEEPTTIKGIWKQRFLNAQQVLIEGFAGIQSNTLTPEQLAFAFDQIRIAGNTLRVQWGPFVRTGILKSFRVTPDRIEDIAWEAIFEWSARNDAEASPAAAEPVNPPDLRRTLNGVDDQLAFKPKNTLASFVQNLEEGLAKVRTQTGKVFDQVRAINGLVTTASDVLGGIQSSTEAIRAEVGTLSTQLVDVPYLDAVASDRVLDVLSTESWRRTLGRRVSAHRFDAQRLEQDIREEVAPEALAVVTLPGDTSLRALALRAYGSADAWQVIADFNGLTGSVVPGGTQIVIPPAPARAGGVQRGDVST